MNSQQKERKTKKITIRPMLFSDIKSVARIHQDAFPTDTDSLEESFVWIYSKFLGWPINIYFVAEFGQSVIGYVLWVEMGGFRKSAVLELEQIGVISTYRDQGSGTLLIDKTIETLAHRLKQRGRLLKLVEITTSSKNEAQRLYKKTLGAQVVSDKADFFDGNEVVMIARKEIIDKSRKDRGLSTLIP